MLTARQQQILDTLEAHGGAVEEPRGRAINTLRTLMGNPISAEGMRKALVGLEGAGLVELENRAANTTAIRLIRSGRPSPKSSKRGRGRPSTGPVKIYGPTATRDTWLVTYRDADGARRTHRAHSQGEAEQIAISPADWEGRGPGRPRK